MMTPLLRTAAVLLKTAELSGPWHSALKLSHLTLAVRSTPIFALAIREVNTGFSFYSVTNLSADFSKTVESSLRHLTLRGPLFEASRVCPVQGLLCPGFVVSRVCLVQGLSVQGLSVQGLSVQGLSVYRRIFLLHDFTSLKLICGVLFGPKLYTNGLSLHTISWHYTFKDWGLALAKWNGSDTLYRCQVSAAPAPPASTLLVAAPPDYPILETDSLSYSCTADEKKTFLPGFPGNQVP
jgi:hypothetical protein